MAQKATATMGDNSRVLTRRLPAWVRARGGKLVLIPERAEVVRRIFDLAAAGYGVPSICRKLTEEGVKPFGRTARWVGGYVGLILKDRRALGEYLPHRVPTEQEVERYEKAGKPVPRRVPDGDPVPGYFPAVVDADLYHAARAGARERLTNPGRLGTTSVNVFAGRLYHARTKDETYFQTQRQFKDGDGVKRVTQILINTSATNGARAYSIPYEPFEAAVLSLLREVDPAELLPTTAPPDETLVLTEELAELDARIACLEAELTQGDVAALARVLRQLEAQRADVAARLDQARERAATPVGAAWAEAQSLAAALANAPDQQDARLRLRSALRRVVTDLRLLVVPKGLDRVCAVQARFADTEEARDWLFVYTPGLKTRAGGVRQASWGAWSVRRAAGPFLDLRDPKDSKRLEDVLSLPVPAVPPRPPVTEDDEARIAAEVAAVPHAPQSPEEVRAALRAAFAGSTSPLMRQLAAAADVKDKAALAWLWAMVTAAKAQG